MKPSLDQLRSEVVPALKRHDVVRAALFGSFARGEQEEASDLDILVEFGKEKSLLDLVALKLELEETLGRGVDDLTYGSLHPGIRERVLKEQVLTL
jgi:hypothetical protein